MNISKHRLSHPNIDTFFAPGFERALLIPKGTLIDGSPAKLHERRGNLGEVSTGRSTYENSV
jgi:hypothetical protein